MSRLTMKLDEPIKTKYLNYEYNRIPDYDIVRGNFGRISDDMVFNKLGLIEDILEEYGIEDLTELKIALDYYNHRYDGGVSTKRIDKKETPMKVVKWGLAQPETRCAKCGAGLERKHDYCWYCGQKIDWSDKQ